MLLLHKIVGLEGFLTFSAQFYLLVYYSFSLFNLYTSCYWNLCLHSKFRLIHTLKPNSGPTRINCSFLSRGEWRYTYQILWSAPYMTGPCGSWDWIREYDGIIWLWYSYGFWKHKMFHRGTLTTKDIPSNIEAINIWLNLTRRNT